MTEFARLLRQHVEAFQARTDAKRQDIARGANCSPSLLSHLLKGTRHPSSREVVLDFIAALRLNGREGNALLLAAGFAPLTQTEVEIKISAASKLQRQTSQEAVQLLRSPEREVLADMMRADVEILTGALTDFVKLRRFLYERRWLDAITGVDATTDQYYWRLRRVAARVRAHHLLVKATAQQHAGPLVDALHTAREGLDAALAASDPVTCCLAYVRLADVQRMQGEFTLARASYGAALTVLRKWGKKTANQRIWARHWQARVQSKIGILLLFEAKPHEALQELRASLVVFRESKHTYERTRVLGAITWAYALLGRWITAERVAKAVLRVTLALERERPDPKARLQAHLSLGGIYLNKRQYAEAQEALEQARDTIAGAKEAAWAEIEFHDVGRVYLLLALVYSRWDEGRDLAKAEENFHAALQFYEHGPWRDSARLAYVRINYGNFYLGSGDAENAYEEYTRALQLSEETRPPHQYYRTGALVERCAAALDLEEIPEVLVAQLDEAKRACETNEYWRHLARLQTTWARACVRWNRLDEAVTHADEALQAARRYNGFLVGETWEALKNLAGGSEDVLPRIKERPGEARRGVPRRKR